MQLQCHTCWCELDTTDAVAGLGRMLFQVDCGFQEFVPDPTSLAALEDVALKVSPCSCSNAVIQRCNSRHAVILLADNHDFCKFFATYTVPGSASTCASVLQRLGSNPAGDLLVAHIGNDIALIAGCKRRLEKRVLRGKGRGHCR